MKKVLLSLVAFLMIFNTVRAEETEVLESNKEVTETVLNANANETTANESQEETTEEGYKWSAIQPGSTKTSNGITVSWEYTGITKNGGLRTINFNLTYTIPEDYEEETLIINPDIFEVIAWGQKESNTPYLMPRDTVKVNLSIINKSKYNYNYDKNSFVIYPYTSDELEKDMGFDKITDEKVTFNDEEVNEVHKFYRMYNAALRELTKNGRKYLPANNETLDELLKAKGYKGIEELDKYYLDFYNNKYETNHANLRNFTPKQISEILNGNNNPTEDGDDYVKEDNPVIVALHFDFLFNYAMGVSLDNEEINDNNQHEYAPGEYMRNESKGEEKVKKNLGKLNSNSENSMNTNMHLSGPLMGNAYADYRITGHAHLSYTAEKGKVIARYIDVKGNVLQEEIITSGMVNKAYKTSALEFNGYELIKVEGNETGLYQSEDTIVTYIYEFVDGIGGDEVPNTGINTNNALEVTTVISMITLVSAIVLRKRFN